MLIYVRLGKVHGPGLCTHQFLSKGNNEDIFGHFFFSVTNTFENKVCRSGIWYCRSELVSLLPYLVANLSLTIDVHTITLRVQDKNLIAVVFWSEGIVYISVLWDSYKKILPLKSQRKHCVNYSVQHLKVKKLWASWGSSVLFHLACSLTVLVWLHIASFLRRMKQSWLKSTGWVQRRPIPAFMVIYVWKCVIKQRIPSIA